MKYYTDVGFLIKLINEKIEKRANKELSAFGITITQGRFLLYLHELESCHTTQKNFEEHFEISHPTTVGIIKRLEEKELVKTYIDERDNRNKIVELAPKEAYLDEKMKCFKQEIEDTLLSGINDKHKNDLVNLLNRIYLNIQD